MFVLLEGGGRLAGSFLDAGEIDQFLYIITPKIAGDGVPSLAADRGGMPSATPLS